MPLTPGYGETPLPHDELTALIPGVVEILDKPITKAAVYDLEQGVQDQVSEELLTAAIEGSLPLNELLSEIFIRDLHTRLYGDIWIWAGRWRRRELNIGVAPEQIAVELRSCLDNIRYRWEHTEDWTARALGITVHAETVRIHPFTDGNGRTTRLLADLVFIVARRVRAGSTTGTSISRTTSSCSAPSTFTGTLVSLQPSSVCSRLSREFRRELARPLTLSPSGLGRMVLTTPMATVRVGIVGSIGFERQ